MPHIVVNIKWANIFIDKKKNKNKTSNHAEEETADWQNGLDWYNLKVSHIIMFYRATLVQLVVMHLNTKHSTAVTESPQMICTFYQKWILIPETDTAYCIWHINILSSFINDFLTLQGEDDKLMLLTFVIQEEGKEAEEHERL